MKINGSRVAEQHRLNEIHASHPFPGDYWQEHLVGYFVVLEPVPGGAVICDKKIDYPDGWSWDLEAARFMSSDEMYREVRYSSFDGWVADVSPALHMGTVRDWVDAGRPMADLKP